jgi:hypothetical protein
MNFFKRQAEARRYTALLVFYLFIAMTLIIVAVNAVVYVVVVAGGTRSPDLSAGEALSLWPIITVGTLLVIVAGSLARFLTLRRGGRAVAELMSARPVGVDSRDPLERRLINVERNQRFRRWISPYRGGDGGDPRGAGDLKPRRTAGGSRSRVQSCFER